MLIRDWSSDVCSSDLLAWFMNFTPDEWREPFAQGGYPWDGQFYVEMAQTLERACFDYIMIEDKLMVPETFGGNRDYALKAAMVAPKHDPAPLAEIGRAPGRERVCQYV